MHVAGCELCEGDGGELLASSGKLRIVKVLGADGAAYPGFCRVIWSDHVKELTDLPEIDRHAFMTAVFALETVLRKSLQPEKMNVASLGNLTPHLHWHVIPRFRSDPAFPKPVWAITTPPAPSLDTLDVTRAGPADRSDADWVSAVKRAFASV
ncbi:MAG: HIT family protein [Usitatibacteraceae bacterium]